MIVCKDLYFLINWWDYFPSFLLPNLSKLKIIAAKNTTTLIVLLGCNSRSGREFFKYKIGWNVVTAWTMSSVIIPYDLKTNTIQAIKQKIAVKWVVNLINALFKINTLFLKQN